MDMASIYPSLRQFEHPFWYSLDLGFGFHQTAQCVLVTNQILTHTTVAIFPLYGIGSNLLFFSLALHLHKAT